MIRVFIDINVFFNVWFKEIDFRILRLFWKVLFWVFKFVEEGNIKGIVFIFIIMELVYVFRRKGVDLKIV